MSRNVLLSGLLVCLIKLSAFARQDFSFAPITRLAGTVNSSAEEILPILSADGQTLYFVRGVHPENKGGRFGGQDIWFSEKDSKGEWKKARQLDQFNNGGNNAVVGMDQSGKVLYLLNSYEGGQSLKSGLSYSELGSDLRWTAPQLMNIKDIYALGAPNDVYGLRVNDDSDVLLISMEGKESLGAEDLYVSFKFTGWNRFHQPSAASEDEGFYWWSPPIHLGDVVNSKGYDIAPFLSPDGKTLFFASDRPGGLGSADLYYSHRLDDSWKNWTPPVNLGKEINSRYFDAYLSISAKDSTVYFASARGGRFSDLYSSRFVAPEAIPAETGEPVPALVAEDPPTVEEEREDVPEVKTDKELTVLNRIERNVLFDHNSANLLLKDLDLLENTVAILLRNPRLEVHLVGHTDHIGSPEQNLILSKNRAKSVMDYLTKHGVEPGRIAIDGYGENDPIEENQTRRGREQNRRVELYFMFR